MKVGLFICDHVNAGYKGQFGDYPDMFARLFPGFDWILYDVCNGHFPENLEDCDFYMATGSKHSVYEELGWIVQLKEIIVQLYEQQKYFIGFCFGHQLIGEALGGRVGKSPNGWCVGNHAFEIIESKDWMIPSMEKINLLMMCKDQILELPKNATVLAKSDLCPFAMVTVGHRILGIQSHPEFTKAYDKILMESRIGRIGGEKVKRGIQSLSNDIHTNIIQTWILKFINKN